MKRVILIAVAFAGAPVRAMGGQNPAAAAHERDVIPRCVAHHYSCETGWAGYVEEDGWQWTRLAPGTDRNYTMGVGVARSGAPVIEQRHDFALRWADRALASVADATVLRLRFLATLRRFDTTLARDTAEKAYGE